MRKFSVALQMEYSALLWGILGILSYIADSIRPGLTPKIMCAAATTFCVCYFIGSIFRSKK